MPSELRCQNCRGPLSLKSGQTIILPSMCITINNNGDIIEQEFIDNGWCGDCVQTLDKAITSDDV